jgi:protein-S-isoprenylcysteine O-methyltransferase Ste14
MNRILTFLYGIASYASFLAVYLYLIGFLGGFIVPKTVDSGAAGHWATALVINALLIALFGLQHTVMARPTFKRMWTRIVPTPAERSTYVLMTSVALGLLYWLWQPMTAVVWHIESPQGQAVMWTLFALGWVTVLITTFLINHFDLFGLRQVWLHLRGKPYTRLGFVTPGPYKSIRHPLYVGWITGFWATPLMTAGHLLFALGMTAYILVAIFFEERNLAQFHGERYLEYRRRVPMFIPRLTHASAAAPAPETAAASAQSS